MGVVPIEEGRREEVLMHTELYIQIAEGHFGQVFERIPVLFDLSGRSAGMFRVHGRQRAIRYNPWIFAKYYRENLESTVPHEVAHYIVHEMFPQRGIKPHGPEWRELMGHFEADPGVTFDLDLSGVPQRRQRSHPYRCGCRVHLLSTTRHNRVQRGTGEYQCTRCGGPLVHDPEAVPGDSVDA